MVLAAPAANNFTLLAISVQSNETLQREVDLTERAIRNAANRQQFNVLYDARIIGNPPTDPQDTNALTALQVAYRDAFVDAGYLVTLDADTGLWRLSWEASGVEELVSVYSVRTTVIPGAVSQQTIDTIDSFFNNQVPVARSRTTLVNVSPGADTDEQDFGAAISTFYEYLVVVQQQDPTTDFSSGIRSALVGTSLGYVAAPSNVFVYKTA